MRRPHALLAGLLVGMAGLAYGAGPDQACGGAGCAAGSLDPAAVRAALRRDDRDTTRERSAGLGGARAAALPDAGAADPASAWERRLGGPGAREDYDCALSFGVGGTLGGDGFLASRLLGRTKVWRDLSRK